jgi:hypothetical protein
VRWESAQPQEEIYLVAARFTEYTQPAGRIKAMVFLRTPDEELAVRYLDATARYVVMYEKLIGPYPYTKFALVENFWETGFGMPSRRSSGFLSSCTPPTLMKSFTTGGETASFRITPGETGQKD